jgi:hypothetical protein
MEDNLTKTQDEYWELSVKTYFRHLQEQAFVLSPPVDPVEDRWPQHLRDLEEKII